MEKHTKGPWAVYYNKHSELDAKYHVYCANRKCPEEGMNIAINLSEEDAHLVAAAPELLEGIKDALMMCRKHGIDSTWECALEKLIAKAEGKSE